MTDKHKRYLYPLLSVILLAVTAIVFFAPDDLEGNVLQQHDIMQGIANGQEGKAYEAETGNTTRWTNSLFGGMPNFQIAPTYPANKVLEFVGKAYMLWLPSPANLLFAMMLGFFIMCLCFRFKWHSALFGAIAWGFSSYFIILIGAGHIWKFVTLAYIPPTIGGIALCYRRKYLAGMALAALFGALQLQSNHPQMSYYFILVILAMMLAWLWTAVKEKKVKDWTVATVCVIGAGTLAVAANSASLYNTYEYAKQTVRGKASDLSPEPGTQATGGMDREAITAWSYGVDETWTLLIPNVKGGATIQPVAGETRLKSLAQTDKANDLTLSPEEFQFLDQFPQYFGDQPMTNGPVYVGAFVFLLAILALFMVEGPMKWVLFIVSVIAIMLSWGHNFPWLTNLMIDSFPGYNKFRAVSSILVVVEFCIPLLAVMCVKKLIDDPKAFTKNPWVTYTVMGAGAFICLIGAIAPGIFGQPFSAAETEQLQAAGAYANPAYYNVIDAIRQTRLSLVRGDCLRSLLFIAMGSAILFIYLKGKLNPTAMTCAIGAVVLIDLFSVNTRYVNSDNFTRPQDNTVAFQMTNADREILKDTTNYRVLDVAGFTSARSSYFHKTVGGYHAAKLTRYNDLIEKQISRNNPEVLNMLNTKYLMSGDEYQINPGANGNAWFVSRMDYVDNADREMAALDTIPTKHVAVADRQFAGVLGQAVAPAPGDTIYETSYAPDRLTYKARTRNGGVAVFSEIFFPWGWEAVVDGKAVPIGRVDYVLRAIRLTPGNHDITFTFDPKSLRVTNGVAMTGVIAIYALCLVALAVWIVSLRRKRNGGKKDPGIDVTE